ncbi:YbjC family protein [Enterobacillus tribolii]|uniref:Uncharacterized protein DUF1418 n=1 Tax=Enterobacillus tribolii TaxID=1487935 RepID=A0A370QM95_9GAMM|nr:YbjC family protein [Enterobacillus tribolii]MBW7982328.1 DUF1418 family protein [Enterobacillus tribolii]RDK89494.1 uncharacterized protein DUF1418 [Enterobacillus tribolii]
MRALGDMPKSVLALEALGMLLLIAAYLSINGYVALPGWLATPAAAVIMVFGGVALMVPAAVVLILRATRGGIQLLGATPSSRAKETQTQHEDSKHDADH